MHDPASDIGGSSGDDDPRVRQPEIHIDSSVLVGWRPAAPGFAALAVATVLVGWRPAAPGFAALAVATVHRRL